MSLRTTARLSLWACGICAVLAAVGLLLGIFGDSLAWIYVSIAGSVLLVPLLAGAVVALVLSARRERTG